MKTSHKRLGEHLSTPYRQHANLMEAFDNLADRDLVEEMKSRRRKLLNLGEAAAHAVVLRVLNEDLRLAKLPYRRIGWVVPD